MKTMKCSTFQGFTKHKEDQELIIILEEIKSGKYRFTVTKIRKHIEKGEDNEAGNIKRQLQAATLSALYTKRRLPETITGYNDVIMLDFDKLTPEEITQCRQVIEADSNTLFCFLSPSGNGLKVGVHLINAQAAKLREEFLNADSIKFELLEIYHKDMFDITKAYYESLCRIEIDPSGSDIGRLFFFSHDPDIYINYTAIRALNLPQLTILPPKPEEVKGTRKKMKKDLPGNPDINCDQIPIFVQMEFLKCMKSVERSLTYDTGSRDVFIYALANKCYKKELPLRAVEKLVEKYYSSPDMDVIKPVRNAYQYTSKTDQREKEKKKPICIRIAEFADEHYDIRRNSIMKRLEFRLLNDSKPHVPLKAMHFNTIFCDLNHAGIQCAPATVKSVINSTYAKEFNPFEDYFYNLPPWNGEKDYILELADTVQTTNQPFWRDCFRRWLTGMVACALDEFVVNQLAIVIRGEQGKGKSTWIRRLLPPELKLHYRNGMLNPDNKDHALALTTCLIINLEEFEGMKFKEIGELKRMITQESVMERKAFDTDADLYIRCASIIASTNEARFLQDISGSRRFPTVTTTTIDYHKPVNHTGIFSQAMYLWKNGFHYWYEDKEIESLNQQNREYSLSIPEEELLYVHFDKPLPTDYEGVKWLPAAAILSYLSIYGKLQFNQYTLHTLTNILERDLFEKRKNDKSIYEYLIRQKTAY